MFIEIIAVDSDNLCGFCSHLFTLLHIIQEDLFIIQYIHHKIHQQYCLIYCLTMINNTRTDDIHTLNVTQLRVKLVKVYQKLAEKLLVTLALKCRMRRKCARNVLLDLLQGIALLFRLLLFLVNNVGK